MGSASNRLVLAVAIAAASFGAGVGAASGQESRCGEQDWEQAESAGLNVWYPGNHRDEGREIAGIAGPMVGETAPKVAEVFGLTATPDIFIRVYPDESTFLCLNPVAYATPITPVFGIGENEIVVLLDRLSTMRANWPLELSESMAGGLLQLAANSITEGTIPFGLFVGIGGYGIPPDRLLLEGGTAIESELPLLVDLVSNRGVQRGDALFRLQATSFVAYLVDTYGWTDFVSVLSGIRPENSSLEALKGTYGIQIQTLENGWHGYWESYLDGRIHHHLLYSIDLERQEELISIGAYETAVTELREIMPFATLFGSASVPRATGLLDRAESGLEGEALLVQARQALLDGRYAESLVLAQQASGKFNELDNEDRRREVEEFIGWASDVLSLRAEIVYWSERTGIWSIVAIPRLIAIRDKLSELGDSEGVTTVSAEIGQSFGSQVKVLRAAQIVLTAGVLLALLRAIRSFAGPRTAESRLG